MVHFVKCDIVFHFLKFFFSFNNYMSEIYSVKFG